MTAYCSEPHPVEPDVYCNRPEGNHQDHSAYSPSAETYVDWPNPAYVVPPTVARREAERASKARIRRIASRVRGKTSGRSETL